MAAPRGRSAELKKIAARSGEPALAYATDEDTRGIDPDPLANRFDMGKDPIAYAKLRAQVIGELWPKVIDEVTKDGDGYQQARRAFGILLGNHGKAMYLCLPLRRRAIRQPGPQGRSQRPGAVRGGRSGQAARALTLLEEQVFSDKPFQFPPDLYNHLAASRWNHWGTTFRCVPTTRCTK